MNQFELMQKGIDVINSCRNLHQLDGAINYCGLISRQVDRGYLLDAWVKIWRRQVKMKRKRIQALMEKQARRSR